jgi:hypothetical protein
MEMETGREQSAEQGKSMEQRIKDEGKKIMDKENSIEKLEKIKGSATILDLEGDVYKEPGDSTVGPFQVAVDVEHDGKKYEIQYVAGPDDTLEVCDMDESESNLDELLHALAPDLDEDSGEFQEFRDYARDFLHDNFCVSEKYHEYLAERLKERDGDLVEEDVFGCGVCSHYVNKYAKEDGSVSLVVHREADGNITEEGRKGFDSEEEYNEFLLECCGEHERWEGNANALKDLIEGIGSVDFGM